MEIEYEPPFIRSYKKLPKEIKTEFLERRKIFKDNRFHPILKVHKLKGRLAGLFSMSVSHHYRAIFEFVSKDMVIFHDIGTHDIYE